MTKVTKGPKPNRSISTSRYKFAYNIRDIHRMYKKRCKDIGRAPMNYKEYKKVVGDMLRIINLKMINERFVFTPPYQLGVHYVRSHKPRSRQDAPIDWGATQKVGKPVIHLNRHTFGYFHKLYWHTRKAFFKHRKFYSWQPYKSRKAGEELGIGKFGLARKIKEVSEDPYQTSFFKV